MPSLSLNPVMDKRILVVGLSCVDIINYVKSYPIEDSDSRILKQIWTVGGNATNNVIVLNQLNSYSVLFSAIPINCILITSLLAKVGVSSEHCLHRLDGELPTSTVIVNENTGSRTIMHYRGQLQEPNCEEFQLSFPDINIFSWIHFEGRNFENVIMIINYILVSRQNNEKPKISLECEKVRDFETLENAIPLVDVVFVSKDFARKKGFQNKEETVLGIQQEYGTSHAIVICPWAEQGVAARDTANGEMISVDAFVEAGPAIDTLGAGDCFIACCIHFLNEGNNLREVLVKACRITGKKVARRGLLGLDVS
uniref:PfkB domain-containing protein n=1 Tax=Onchocerca volvulus TaxID=6282 RepID=A0A8R1XX31_ONCVO